MLCDETDSERLSAKMIVAEAVFLDSKRMVNKTKYVKRVEIMITVTEEHIS
jgi:hypothetical protein